MEKGYYGSDASASTTKTIMVAIHNKNGKGLLPKKEEEITSLNDPVAIHNKNGKGLLPEDDIPQKPFCVCRNPQ